MGRLDNFELKDAWWSDRMSLHSAPRVEEPSLACCKKCHEQTYMRLQKHFHCGNPNCSASGETMADSLGFEQYE